MNTFHHRIIVLSTAVLWTSAVQAQWVTFSDETALRMPVGPGLNDPATSTADTKEKSYAWGDVDNDGDIDLISARKVPFSVAGGMTNVLFMNEGIAEGHAVNGVLVDHTAQYATASDVMWDDPATPEGPLPDQGFLTPTNDRHVILINVNNDGWLDVVTSVAVSDGLPKHIGHPRIYINLGEIEGVWQGFRYEEARIPFMGNPSQPLYQPRFGGLAAGDVTGDGYVDLHFADYDTGQTGPPETYDYNNKLLINMGRENPGYFVDSLNTRMSTNPGLLTAFGMTGYIGDMNGDGTNDVVKITALTTPQHIAVQHNDPNNVGYFPDPLYKIVYSLSGYHCAVGDLNGDGKLDIAVGDDNADRYLLNTGNAANGTVQFAMYVFQFHSGGDDGFPGDAFIADLDNDGWNDVVIADVEEDGFGCGRRAHFYHNLGNAPNVTLKQEELPVIPHNKLIGTHHIAILDIDGDGWKDLVIGRCSSTQVWRNTTPIPGDTNGDHRIDVDDLLAVISAWGPCTGCPADLNDDGQVSVDDLLLVITYWEK